MAEEELQFPLDFEKCPSCGSQRRVAETVANQQKAKGVIGKDARACAFTQNAIITDPRTLLIEAPVLLTFYDICTDCGIVYCVHAELGKAKPQDKRLQGQPPAGGPFPFPGRKGI